MTELVKNILIAFLGGSFALIIQWYIYHKERLGTRRSVLYVLIEVYSKLARLERIKSTNELFKNIFDQLNFDSVEIDQVRPFLSKILFDSLFDVVQDELDELNDSYPDLVLDLSKDEPIIAYKISHHTKSLTRLIQYFDEILNELQDVVTEQDFRQTKDFFNGLLQKNILVNDKKDIYKSLMLVSRSISIFQLFRTKKLLKEINEFNIDDNEIIEMVNQIKFEIQNQINFKSL